MTFEEKSYPNFVVQSCQHLTDVDVTLIVSGRYEKASLVLHEICRAAIRKALGPMSDVGSPGREDPPASGGRFVGA